ncbi:MAG: hypothetical protein IKQ82_06985 [Lentisphaeria bacterium]|nr:hypothetical protein [Lentisphaeria bacterium]
MKADEKRFSTNSKRRTGLGNRHPARGTLKKDLRAPLKIGFRRLFASGQCPTGKIFGGYLQVATLKSFCIVLFAHTLKIHPIEFSEIPLKYSGGGPAETVRA